MHGRASSSPSPLSGDRGPRGAGACEPHAAREPHPACGSGPGQGVGLGALAAAAGAAAASCARCNIVWLPRVPPSSTTALPLCTRIPRMALGYDLPGTSCECCNSGGGSHGPAAAHVLSGGWCAAAGCLCDLPWWWAGGHPCTGTTSPSCPRSGRASTWAPEDSAP
jgi:hypothetical protein